MSRIGALDLRDAVLDQGSFHSWDTPPVEVDTSEAYRRELADATAKTGLDESVVTGEGTVEGRRVAFVACEFDFLAGSIGVAAAERITSAVQRATAERLPLLASPSSGGTRMLVADILALINSDGAQRKLFDSAFAASAEEQAELLNRTADSVRLFGDKAEERHVTALLDLIANSAGDVAEAAATVHGALNLPTTGAVNLLPQQPKDQ